MVSEVTKALQRKGIGWAESSGGRRTSGMGKKITVMVHCEAGWTEAAKLRKGPKAGLARPHGPHEEFGFYLKGNWKPLNGLRQSSDMIWLSFEKMTSQPIMKNELEGLRAEGKRPVKRLCHGGLGQGVSSGDEEQCIGLFFSFWVYVVLRHFGRWNPQKLVVDGIWQGEVRDEYHDFSPICILTPSHFCFTT